MWGSNIAYIAIFVKTDAKEIMEEIAVLFSRFPRISPDLKIDVCQVLKKMILYHFQDDLNKTQELLYLITMNFTDEEVDKMNSYEREIYAMSREIARVTEEKDKVIIQQGQVIIQQCQKIRELSEKVGKLENSK